jgi:L-alanine-DL-glutamate epimerase-like enolase superfamily enzyme
VAHDETVHEGLLAGQVKACVERVQVSALTLATKDQPESDGTTAWNATTMILVECSAQGVTGIGYSYSHLATAKVVDDVLVPCVRGLPVEATGEAHARMQGAVRNYGREGIAAAAISAVDVALWDLKARLLESSLGALLGFSRRAVPAYASGGFTSSGLEALQREFSSYAALGFRDVKLKIGREPEQDVSRVRAVREAVGPSVRIMVDANGAYQRKQALRFAEQVAAFDVRWFEEPVSSDDLDGLRLLRDRCPAGMAIAAGEYGYDTVYFGRMLAAQAVDVLQADATRCAGVTGFLRADALCAAHGVPLSSHCAPTLHAQLGAAASQFSLLECFRDHVRMEEMLFDGVPELRDGALHVNSARLGLGITLRREEVKRHAA